MSEGKKLYKRGIKIFLPSALIFTTLAILHDGMHMNIGVGVGAIKLLGMSGMYGLWLIVKGLWTRRGERQEEIIMKMFYDQIHSRFDAADVEIENNENNNSEIVEQKKPQNIQALDVQSRLRHLQELHEQGLVTKVELKEKKRQILQDL